MSKPTVVKDFPDIPSCHRWATERGLSGILSAVHPDVIAEEMFPGGVRLTLEGEHAQRVLDIEHPIDPAGFRLTEIERFA